MLFIALKTHHNFIIIFVNNNSTQEEEVEEELHRNDDKFLFVEIPALRRQRWWWRRPSLRFYAINGPRVVHHESTFRSVQHVYGCKCGRMSVCVCVGRCSNMNDVSNAIVCVAHNAIFKELYIHPHPHT